jgi:hypothetical protein
LSHCVSIICLNLSLCQLEPTWTLILFAYARLPRHRHRGARPPSTPRFVVAPAGKSSCLQAPLHPAVHGIRIAYVSSCAYVPGTSIVGP